MTYNIHYLISALLFLVLVFYHFIKGRRLGDSNNRVFCAVICIGMMDILFDLLATVLIDYHRPEYAGVTLLFMTVFYLIQVLVPYMMFLYSWSLGDMDSRMENAVFKILQVPAVLMIFMVCGNVHSGIFFSIDKAGNYIKGTYYLGMYLYAMIYVVITLLAGIIRYRKLGFQKFCVICEFLLIMSGCVLVQGIRNDLLTTGLGIGLGVTALYLSINNPSNYTDLLTGNFNMRSLLGWLQELFRKKKKFHVISLSINNLEQINKLSGIRCGDDVLCEVSEKLNELLGTSYVFRTSSKRFVVLTYSLEKYKEVRDGIEVFLRTYPAEEKGYVAIYAVICGIVGAENLKSCDTLLSYLDYMLSCAQDGQNVQVVESSGETWKGFLYNTEIEHFLHSAIEQDLFEIYFQPVYSMKERRFVTAEALSRLSHPVYGPISPETFISIAEQNGQIAQIDNLQFRRICRFLKEHPDVLQKLDYINVNLSPAELLREECGKRLMDTMREFGLPFSAVQFEITETVATEYSDKLYQIAEEFSGYGIRLSLDDFGSGYANLNTVLKLPFATIKLDRSLLNGILKEEKASCFYRNIVSILNNMGYRVISEGVEEKNEAELLRSWGVEMIQGYYYSRPLPEKELLILLTGAGAK